MIHKGLGLALCVLGISSVAPAQEKAPPKVRVDHPVFRDVTEDANFAGRVQAAQSVEIRSRAGGYLTSVHSKDGAEVRAGELLFEIDAQPYKVELDRANAAVSRAEKLAAERERQMQIHLRLGIAADAAQFTVLLPLVEAQGDLLMARAAREAAALRLAQTKIIAPIDGRMGRALLTPGNLVVADVTRLTTLVGTKQVHVHFRLDERTFLRLRRLAQENKPGVVGEARVALSDEKDFPHGGQLDLGDNQLTDGMLGARVILDNDRGLFVPGMSARVRLTLRGPYRALLIPQMAASASDGRVVFVVTDKNTVEVRPVKLGLRHGTLYEVVEGLTPNDLIVVEERPDLLPGMEVVPLRTTTKAPE